MITSSQSSKAAEYATAPRWHTTPLPMSDVNNARLELTRTLLKGMPESSHPLASARVIVFGVGATA